MIRNWMVRPIILQLLQEVVKEDCRLAQLCTVGVLFWSRFMVCNLAAFRVCIDSSKH